MSKGSKGIGMNIQAMACAASRICRAKSGAARLVTVFGLGFALLAPATANAQRLWSVESVERRPEAPAMVMDGTAVGPGVLGPGGVPAPVEAAEVQVELDYLRLGMATSSCRSWMVP